MKAADYFERLLRYYEGSFDLESPAQINGRSYAGCGEFHAHSEKYVLLKKAQLWAADSHEYCLFETYDSAAPDKAEVERLKKVMIEYMEPVMVRKNEKTMPHDHMYTFMTLVLISERPVSEETVKAVQKFHFTKFYSFYIRGYSEGRIVLLDLAQQRVYTNSDGKVLKKFHTKVMEKLLNEKPAEAE